jgi:hypothetical protein
MRVRRTEPGKWKSAVDYAQVILRLEQTRTLRSGCVRLEPRSSPQWTSGHATSFSRHAAG